MGYVRQMWKQIFVILTYTNMNMKKTWQGYGARSCLKLVLNRLKEMRASYYYLYHFEDLAQESFERSFLMCIKWGGLLGTFLN
jgi:hypothetical protein